MKQFQRVDILVNNAAIAPNMPFLDITDEMRNDVSSPRVDMGNPGYI